MVVEFTPDGSLDTTFVPPTNGLVILGSGTMGFYALGPVSAEGGLYIFGRFTQPTGTALRLQADGSIDPTFGLATNDEIEAGVLESDDKLIFSHGGTLERANRDGSTDAAWQRSGAFTFQLSMLPDGKLLAGNKRVFTGVGPAVIAPALGFTLTPGGLRLTWPTGYQLQSATRLVPANWQTLLSPSPFTVPLSGPGEFYRVVAVP